MSEKQLPSAGIGTGTTLTTVLTGVLTSLVSLVPPEYREAYKDSLPFLCPIATFLVLGAYNRLIEPPGLAGLRRKLEKDAKSLNKMRKDKTLTPEQKQLFDDDYIETQRQIGRLGRDYAQGKYQSI
ncbi:hypothetical protein NS303_12805 [Pantoea ananatis]|uniref:hypothetical protein n=1 Tax=Pantoea ananas TaxID=553 RepID=UPI0007371A04|nr:hypothetical protein [Pantoea ananatis]KTR47992.1 hypothetical protein NS303_12805 [Pantoea ananatis]KTR54576.1 hypothetical protein NS311_15575 [Pantoea ananatis]KTR65242.1 hypothetical protein RSA47_10085 [Pantoea ananatis]KTR72541.1 hypothetical protein NS296_02750 [Pantoea ananatis]